jgi:hypothetical protein
MCYVCPVCGFEGLPEPAYNEYNEASYELCSCCFFQFGVDDDVEIKEDVYMEREDTHKLYRKQWIDDGAKLLIPLHYPAGRQLHGKVKPEALSKQLKNINVTL